MAALHWLIHTRSPHSSIKRLFLFFFPSSVLFFLFLSLTSAFLLLITEGRGIMKPQLTQAVLGPVSEKRSALSPSLSLSLPLSPSHSLSLSLSLSPSLSLSLPLSLSLFSIGTFSSSLFPLYNQTRAPPTAFVLEGECIVQGSGLLFAKTLYNLFGTIWIVMLTMLYHAFCLITGNPITLQHYRKPKSRTVSFSTMEKTKAVAK